VHALGTEGLDNLLTRSLAAVVCVVDDDLAALDGEEVPDLLLEAALDAFSKRDGFWGFGAWC
jgi:hypothetical protein